MLLKKRFEDKDLIYTVLNQTWRLVSGPITMLAIPLFLNPDTQGYWFTFISLASFSSLANLGFSTIVMQFSAHEFAFLSFNTDGTIEGKEDNLLRLACFFKFVLKWIVWSLVLIFPFVIISGWYVLKQKINYNDWELTWVLYSLATAGLFVNSSLGCFFQGCNSVKKIQSMELKSAVVTTISTLLGLYAGLGLGTLVLSTLLRCIVFFLLLIYSFKKSIVQLLRLSFKYEYSWFKEFFSLMWRYIISWSSAMLMTQLFTPLAFNFYGPVIAGQIGFTITMWNAAKWIVYSFFIAAIPKINIMVELKEWNKLDKFFNRRCLSSILAYMCGGLIFFINYGLFSDTFFLFNRLSSLYLILAVFFNEFCTLIINIGAIYLRAHKEDPTMPVAMFTGIFIAVSSYCIAKNLPSEFLFLGSLTGYVCFFIPATIILIVRKRNMHKADIN